MAQSGLKFLSPAAPGAFRVQQHLLVAVLPLLREKGSPKGNLCFPPFHTAFPGACATQGISWEQVFVMKSSIYLCWSVGCSWVTGPGKARVIILPAQRGRVGFAEQPCPRVPGRKSFSKAWICYQISFCANLYQCNSTEVPTFIRLNEKGVYLLSVQLTMKSAFPFYLEKVLHEVIEVLRIFSR